MSYERFIGLRYLMAKKRTQVVSIITLISITGVALGVTALIVVLSVMGGFKKDLKDKILGTKAHAVVEASGDEDLKKAGEIADRVSKVDGVVGAEPFLESEVMVSSPTNLSGVILRGIDPDRVGEVSELKQDIIEGKLEYLADAAPLLDEIERERDERHQGLLERIEAEKEAYDKEAEDSGSDEASDDADAPEADSDAEDAIMPPIAGDEEAEADGESAMPPIFDDGDEQQGDAADDDAQRLPGLLIGPELAKSLQVDLGSEVNVVTPEGEMGPTGPLPRSRPFRVVGIFKTGMYEYDANYAYTSLADARDFLNREGVTGVEIKTVDPNRAVAIAATLQEMLGDKFEVLDWQEMNRSLFYALELEKIAMFVVLTFIILVASFSIIAMLIMIVIEKAREIAILKSMGVSDAGIMRIFVFQGFVIGALGAVIGLLLGLGICVYLSVHGVPLDSEVYYISKLPVEVNPFEVVAVIGAALGISLISTLYPSYLAAQLKPVDGLRYD